MDQSHQPERDLVRNATSRWDVTSLRMCWPRRSKSAPTRADRQASTSIAQWIALHGAGGRPLACGLVHISVPSGATPVSRKRHPSPIAPRLHLRPDFCPAAINLGSASGAARRTADGARLLGRRIAENSAPVFALLNQRLACWNNSVSWTTPRQRCGPSLTIPTRSTGRHPTLVWHVRQRMAPGPILSDTNPWPLARRSDGELWSARGTGAD